MKKKLSLGLLIVVVLVAAVAASPASSGNGDEGIQRAIDAQERHNNELLAKAGVVGTAVGLNEGGQPVVLVLTERAGVAGIPRSLDGVPVRVRVSGKIFAAHHAFGHCGGPPGSQGLECDTGGGNAAPTADSQSVSTAEATEVDISLTASDNESCELVFAVVTGPAGGSLGGGTPQDCTSGTPNTDSALVTYTPNAGTTSDSFTFKVTDDGDPALDSNTATVSITVGDAATDCFADDETRVLCGTPVPIGVSIGPAGLFNIPGDDRSFCLSGTYGLPLIDEITNDVFALSNAHVLALEGVDPVDPVDPVVAELSIRQPGGADTRCFTDPDQEIGTLFKWAPLQFPATACDPQEEPFDPDCNKMDAAIASSTSELISNTTPNDGYGSVKTATAEAFFNQKLQKYGRTSNLTKGRVAGINATVTVNYDTGTARFVGQILIKPGNFIVGGDSGSVAVVQGGQDKNKPVGLLFASSVLFAIATPIDVVLDEFSKDGPVLTVNGE